MKLRIYRLDHLEEDTEIIGENFTLHYTKYARRPLMEDLPMEYRLVLFMQGYILCISIMNWALAVCNSYSYPPLRLIFIQAYEDAAGGVNSF